MTEFWQCLCTPQGMPLSAAQVCRSEDVELLAALALTGTAECSERQLATQETGARGPHRRRQTHTQRHRHTHSKCDSCTTSEFAVQSQDALFAMLKDGSRLQGSNPFDQEYSNFQSSRHCRRHDVSDHQQMAAIGTAELLPIYLIVLSMSSSLAAFRLCNPASSIGPVCSALLPASFFSKSLLPLFACMSFASSTTRNWKAALAAWGYCFSKAACRSSGRDAMYSPADPVTLVRGAPTVIGPCSDVGAQMQIGYTDLQTENLRPFCKAPDFYNQL